MNIVKGAELYRGKAKTMYETNQPEVLIAEFRDDTSAFDGVKKEALKDKGMVNNAISTFIMQYLSDNGVRTHFIEKLSDTETAVRRLKMIPLESVVRNRAAGSLCRRLGIEEGRVLDEPLYETFLKNDELHDPIVNSEHAILFGWANEQQLQEMRVISLTINNLLQALFAKAGLILVDAKYEFGVDEKGQVYLADEISPDSCRIWDESSKEKLDKDRFRQDLGKVIESYQQIASRIGAE